MLNIYDCGKMKMLLPWSLVQNLLSLQKLDVSNFDEMEEKIGDHGRDPTAKSSDNVTLPKLKDFSLKNLSKLKIICKWTMICDSIESISILNCTVLKKFPLHLDGQPPAPS
ncbi:Uncharacterized protein Adt_21970 [Abeliophyllum distichum]|uniref:Disease resistance protein At4g27190-like leucine-rich repeats domain-containing protein n=1 Tax=Abeliophyllum distichum TaxID=126358 RepID=A0ABD1T0V8_9LAMI